MGKCTLCGVVALSLMLGTTRAFAVPVRFPDNGHYYDSLGTGMSWSDAEAAAEATFYAGSVGHLVTFSDFGDDAENLFVAETFTGPGKADLIWLGAFQPPDAEEPKGGWQWVNGQPFTYVIGEPGSYANWLYGQPDNLFNDGDPDVLVMYGMSFFGATQWDDWVNVPSVLYPAAIVEYDTPEPVGIALLSPALLALLARHKPPSR